MGRNVRNAYIEPIEVVSVRGTVVVPPGSIVEVTGRTAHDLLLKGFWQPAPPDTPDEEKVWPEEEA